MVLKAELNCYIYTAKQVSSNAGLQPIAWCRTLSKVGLFVLPYPGCLKFKKEALKVGTDQNADCYLKNIFKKMASVARYPCTETDLGKKIKNYRYPILNLEIVC